MPTEANTDAQRIAELEAELVGLRAQMQDFSYTVSHDLRANLRHILSYAQLVQEDAAALLPAETLGFVHTIADAARHMGLQMDGLMELARLSTVALNVAALPVQALLADVLAELRQQHAGRAVDCQLPTALALVWADPVQLRAALLAVLDNALKFSAQRATPQVSVSASSADGWVSLQVQDNGAGFNPALQTKLFKPFARLHTTKQFAGMGMGLALARKRLERMGASVQAEGVPDAGCTVRITLPAAP